jgi:hypothetical protein
MYYIVVILLFPLLAQAGDIDRCNKEHNPNQRNYCMAITTLSVGDCEKIKNMDLRSTCVFKVRDAQRQVNSFHPMKDRKEITEK